MRVQGLSDSAGDFLSVPCCLRDLEAQSYPFCCCLMGQGPLGLEGFTFYPNTKDLAVSILIGKWLGPTFCEGPCSLCFSYLPLDPQLGQCLSPRLATQGERGNGCSVFPGWASSQTTPSCSSHRQGRLLHSLLLRAVDSSHTALSPAGSQSSTGVWDLNAKVSSLSHCKDA